MKQRIWFLCAHSSIILSVAFLVLFSIDRVNPAMEFLGSEQSDWMLLCYCIVTIVSGTLSAINLYQAAQQRYKAKKRKETDVQED